MGLKTIAGFFKKNRETLKYLLILFVSWRICLFFIAYLGLSAFPNLDFNAKQLFFPQGDLDYWGRWANWDGRAYQEIAASGYTERLTVFFPAYPIFIKVLTLINIPSFWAGFLLSQIFSFIAIFFVYKLAELDFSENIAKRAVLALLIFPTSFYLVSLYSESLMLASAVSSFYFARKKRWLIASILAGISASARLAGVAAIVALFAEFLLKEKRLSKKIFNSLIFRIFVYLLFLFILNRGLNNFLASNLLFSGILSSISELISWTLVLFSAILSLQIIVLFLRQVDLARVKSINFVFLFISFLPLLLYLWFQSINFGSPLFFLSQEGWWGKYFTYPWETVFTSVQFFLSNTFSIGEYPARINLRFIIFLIAFAGLVITYAKLRLSYFFYFLVSFLIPLFSGTLIDFPRYTLIVFPLFIIFGMIENEYVQKIGTMLFILLLGFLTVLFFNGYFFM